MAKLLVKHKVTGETRPMTKSSFDLAGSKRGYVVVGPYVEEKRDAEESPSDKVKKEMEKLKAEKAAKEVPESVTDSITEPDKELKKRGRGRKPKSESDEV